MAKYGRWETGKSIGEGGQGHLFLATDAQKEHPGLFVLKRLKHIERKTLFEREIARCMQNSFQRRPARRERFAPAPQPTACKKHLGYGVTMSRHLTGACVSSRTFGIPQSWSYLIIGKETS